MQMQPADFILKHKPAAVVFENSFSAAGGNGAVVNCNNVNSHDGSPAVLLLCRLAAEMTYISPQQLEVGWQVKVINIVASCHKFAAHGWYSYKYHVLSS